MSRVTKKRSSPKLTERIRDEMWLTGKSLAHISRESGVSRTSLSRFANGTGGLSLASLDRLAAWLGIRVEYTCDPALLEP